MIQGNDPRVCTFCTRVLPNANALLLHYEYSHPEWVKDLFDPHLVDILLAPSGKFMLADVIGIEGAA